MQEIMDREEVIKALGNIAESFLELKPDNEEEGKAIHWGVDVIYQAQQLLKMDHNRCNEAEGINTMEDKAEKIQVCECGCFEACCQGEHCHN